MAGGAIDPPARSNYHRFTRRFKVFTPKFVLAIFVMVNFVTYYDRGVINGALIDIRTDSTISGSEGEQLSDVKGGALVSAFMVGYFATSPIFAALGSWLTPKTIILIGLTGWLIAAVGSGCSVDFYMLAVCRCLVGTGEAAYVGYMITIVDNMAPVTSRTLWVGIFYSMIIVGQSVGIIAGGLLGEKNITETIGGWRIAFVTEAIPMLILYVLLFLMPSDYNKGVEDGEDLPDGEETTTSSLDTTTGGIESGGSVAVKPRGEAITDTPPASGDFLQHVSDHATAGTLSSKRTIALSSETPSSVSQLTSKDRMNGSFPVVSASTEVPTGRRFPAYTTADAESSHSEQLHANDHRVDTTELEAVNPDVPPPIFRAIPLLICNPKWLCLALGYGMYTFALGGIVTYTTQLMVYGPLNYSKGSASIVLGVVSCVTGFGGSIIGGKVLDFMGGSQGKDGTARSCFFMALMIAIALPSGIIALRSHTNALFIPFLLIGVMAAFTITAPVNAAILSSVPCNMRTYAINFSVLVMHGLGDFPSPIVAAKISDAYADGCTMIMDPINCTKNFTDIKCGWFGADSNNTVSVCVNHKQWPTALSWVYAVCGLAIPLWAFVGWKTRREFKQEQRGDLENHFLTEATTVN